MIKRMEEMGFEADLCRWVESFISDRGAVMRMDGREWKVIEVTIGVSQGSKAKIKIKIGGNEITFNKKPTSWLRIQLDRKLRFQHHHEVVMAKAKKVRARVRIITGKHGLNPANAGKVQVVAVQSITLYGAEMWWDNQVGREQDLHKQVNQSARRTTGMF
jgi:hypothetical protein